MSCLSSLKNRPGTQKETDRNMQNYQKVKATKPNIFQKIKGRFENFKTH